MRIHWKRPRIRLSYLALLIFINTLILLHWTQRRDLDEPSISNNKQEINDNRIVRSAGNELNVPSHSNVIIAQRQQPPAYVSTTFVIS